MIRRHVVAAMSRPLHFKHCLAEWGPRLAATFQTSVWVGRLNYWLGPHFKRYTPHKFDFFIFFSSILLKYCSVFNLICHIYFALCCFKRLIKRLEIIKKIRVVQIYLQWFPHLFPKILERTLEIIHQINVIITIKILILLFI